jgi:hypothetical protein
MVILSLIFLHLTSAFVSNFVEQTDRNRYFSVITDSQDSISYLLEDSLTSTVYGIEALDLLDKELPNASRICASLNKRKPKKDDIYQWLILVSKLDCSTINLPPSLTNRLQKGIEKARFTSIQLSTAATLSLIQAGKITESDIDFSVLPQTLGRLFDDAGFMRETTKESSGSAYKTAQTMILVTQLTSRFPKLKSVLSDVIAKLTDSVPDLVKSGKKTGGQLVFQGSLTATVAVLTAICEFANKFDLPEPALDVNAVNRLGKYIVANKYVETVTGSRMILTGVHYLANNPYHQPIAVSVNNPLLDLARDDGKRFTVALRTMDGEYVEPTSLAVKEISELKSGNKVMGNTSMTATNSGSYELNLRDFITEAGIYQIEVDLTHEEESAVIKREIRATTPLPEVKAVFFDFNRRQGVGKVPESERKRLIYSKKSKKVKVSLSAVREGRLEVTVKGMKPEQMHARFTRVGDCEVWQTCTFNVVGTQKSRKYVWKIDVNKEPYSSALLDGKYKVSVLVAGLLTNEQIEWNIGEVEVEMPVEEDEGKDYEPINDRNVYFHARETIEHTFSPPPSQPNSLLAILFTAVIFAPLLGFLFLRDSFIGSIEISYTTNGLLYQLSIVGVCVLVVGYWLALNLFQALNFAFFVCIAAFFFGYKTVKEINTAGGFK